LKVRPLIALVSSCTAGKRKGDERRKGEGGKEKEGGGGSISHLPG